MATAPWQAAFFDKTGKVSREWLFFFNQMADGGALPATGVTPGTYGDATHVGQFTVDAQGRLTNAVEVPIDAENLGGYWSILTNGSPVSPEVIFDANGDVISVWVPY